MTQLGKEYGDPCSLDMSLFGIAYGAARSWNIATDVQTVAACADRLIYAREGVYALLQRISRMEQAVHYGELAWMYNNLYYPGKFELTARKEAELLEFRDQCLELFENLESQIWKKDNFRQELLVTVQGVAVMAELMLLLYGYCVKRRTCTEVWLAQYRTAWLKKNKESELAEIEKMFRMLEKTVAQGNDL